MIVPHNELMEAISNKNAVSNTDDLSDILETEDKKDSDKVEDIFQEQEKELKEPQKKRGRKPTIVLSEKEIDAITKPHSEKDKKDEVEIELELYKEKDTDSEKVAEEGVEGEDKSKESILLETSYYLNELLDLGLQINENTLQKYSPDEIFEGVYKALEKKVLEKHKDEIERNVYKTTEAHLLDEFLVNGGNIDDFISYYSSQKIGLDKYDKLLEEIKSYAPEQYLYVNLLENGFSEEEAIEYIDNLMQEGLLEKEYQKEIRKLEKKIELDKKKLIEESLQGLSEQAKKQAIEEQREIENSKAEIATYLSKTDSFYGYPLNEKQKEEVFDFITVRDEEGLTGLDRYLQSNRNILAVAIFSLFGNEILKSAETFGNERGKRKFFEKLPSSPLYTNKKQSINQVNFEKLNEF